MFILHFLPDNLLAMIVHLILILGVAGIAVGFFLQFIPGILQYRIPIKIVSIILLLSGIYFEGGYTTELMWREKVAEVEAKVALAEALSAEANTMLQTKIADDNKKVNQTKHIIQTRIKEVEKIINKECKIGTESIEIHNAAAKNSVTITVIPGDSK